MRRRRALIPILALGIPVAAGLTLHGALTYSKIGKVRLTATNSGLNFVEGKVPREEKHSDTAGYTWYSPLYCQLGLKEAKQWIAPLSTPVITGGRGLRASGGSVCPGSVARKHSLSIRRKTQRGL
jgi:hypothetical protein